MGTEGMKYSLVSREVIADCVETCVQGQWMDGVLVLGGCDKNMPGGMIGILRANAPAIYVYGGTIKPGRWKGEDLSIVSAFEAVGAFMAGTMSEDFGGIERNACPCNGSCGGMYTANTMSSSFEALGAAVTAIGRYLTTHPETTYRDQVLEIARGAGSVAAAMKTVCSKSKCARQLEQIQMDKSQGLLLKLTNDFDLT